MASLTFRYIHIALDTIVVYGVLEARNMDERAISSAAISAAGVGGVGAPDVKHRRRSHGPRAGLSQRSSSNYCSSSSTGNSSRKEKHGAVTDLSQQED